MVVRVINEEARRPFDLISGPLFRAMVLRESESEHVLILNMHHIISDGWSMGIFVSELAAFYTAYLQADAVELPELPIQYADFAVWQREWLQGDVLDEQLVLLEREIGGRSAGLATADRPSAPAVQTHRGRCASFDLRRRWRKRCRALSQQRGSHAVYDPARGVPNVAVSLHRARGHAGRHADCRTATTAKPKG